jgi:hypothetical protein
VTAFVLVHSPLVGPGTWAAVARCLLDAGHDAVVPDLRHVATAAEPWRHAAGVVADATGQLDVPGPVVLVLHSGAGPYAAVLAEALRREASRPVLGVVFVDAGLPAEPGGAAPVAPPALLAGLEPLADADGVLPPWSRWWGPGVLEQELPDPAARAALRADETRVPLAYLRGDVPVPQGWDGVPGAYLRLSAGYDAEAERAERLGWPVRRLDAGHLHLLVDPDGVAGAVADLARRLTG